MKYLFILSLLLIIFASSAQVVTLDIKPSFKSEPIEYQLTVKNNTKSVFSIRLSKSGYWKDFPSFLYSNINKGDGLNLLNPSFANATAENNIDMYVEVLPDSNYIINGCIIPVEKSYTENTNIHSKMYVKACIIIVIADSYRTFYSNIEKVRVLNDKSKDNKQAVEWLKTLNTPYYLFECLNIFNYALLLSSNYEFPLKRKGIPLKKGLGIPTDDYDNYILANYPESRLADWAKLHLAYVAIYPSVDINTTNWQEKTTKSLTYVKDVVSSSNRSIVLNIAFDIVQRIKQSLADCLSNLNFSHGTLLSVSDEGKALIEECNRLQGEVEKLEQELRIKINTLK